MSALEDIRRFWKRHGEVILQYGLTHEDHSVPNGIGSNTLRAYGKYVGESQKPSRLMKAWSHRQFDKKKPSWPTTAKAFDDFHIEMRDSLAKFWNLRRAGGKSLPIFPYVCKLLDLQMKACIWRGWRMSPSQRLRLLNIAYQPLDTYSLRLLKVIRDAFGEESKLAIPANASMGFVDEEPRYILLQHEIREQCKTAEVPVFAFDYYAWNNRSID
jgi:hypothetical protein